MANTDEDVLRNAEVFTSGQLAYICGVSSALVLKWCEYKLIDSHTVPNSKHRRFLRGDVVAFVREHGLPMPKYLSLTD